LDLPDGAPSLPWLGGVKHIAHFGYNEHRWLLISGSDMSPRIHHKGSRWVRHTSIFSEQMIRRFCELTVAKAESYHPEGLPSALLFHVLQDNRPNKNPTSTSHKPRRSSGAAVDEGSREVAAVEAADPLKLVQTAPHGAVMNRINHGADAATVTSVHRVKTTAIGH
jgi:hypothetical protein